MRKRLAQSLVTVAGAASLLVPLGASAGAVHQGPAACVVVTLPNGATIQLGYAPNGPSDCTKLPE